MSFTVSLPSSLNPASAAIIRSRASKIGVVFDEIENSVKMLLGKPFKFPNGNTEHTIPAKAITQLGPGAQLTSLLDQTNNLACAVACDARFAIVSAGILMMMGRQVLDERAKEGKVEGLIAETAREVINVITGRLAESLRKATGDPGLQFPKEEIGGLDKVPRNALLVVTAQANADNMAAGQVQIWFSDALAAKIK
ncbi:MAG: hypothetical protein HY698_19450 [Deltaproteobacteria bacterium]|nr:hypothetical protein [Deltaproteobacteria bacterium]